MKKIWYGILGAAALGVAIAGAVNFTPMGQEVQVSQEKVQVQEDEIVVHYEWKGDAPYLYYESIDEKEGTGSGYPGVPMTKEAENWYTYTIKNAQTADISFIVPSVNYETAQFKQSAGEWWLTEDYNWLDEKPQQYELAVAKQKEELMEPIQLAEVVQKSDDASSIVQKNSVLQKNNAESKITIHYSTDWKAVSLYGWNGLPNDVDFTWPGETLQKDGDGYYTYTFSNVKKVNFMFTNDGNRSEEFTIKESGEYWYSNGKWVKQKPGTATTPPSIGPGSTPTPSEKGDFRDETIYFIMTSRFYDGDSSNNCVSWRDSGTDDNNSNPKNPEGDPVWRGDFKGLVEKLDYIKALGFSAVWITPVVKNASDYDYHGYHAINHSVVDVRNESGDCTYQDLINACHERGMKIIQDIVLNHCSDYGEENLFPAYTRTDDISKLGRSDTALTLTDLGKSIGMTEDTKRNEAKRCANLKSDKNDPDRIFHHETSCQWEGYTVQTGQMGAHCVDLNTENPTVTEYLKDCYVKYINMGVDAFRIDTVKHVSRLSFNSAFLPFFKEAGGKNFFMFGEACVLRCEVWNANLPGISVPFYTWKETKDWGWNSSKTLEATLNNEALVEKHFSSQSIGDQPTSTNAFLEGNNYHTPDRSQASGMDMIDFYMHHSFDTAGNAFGKALEEDKYFNDSTWNVMYVDSHDYGPNPSSLTQRYTGTQDAWAENLNLIFTFRGIPCIYYGTEIEFMKGAKIDDWHSPIGKTGRAYFGDHIEGTVNATDFGVYNGATGAMKETLEYPLAQHIQRLNQIRRAIPALRKGQYSTEGVSGGIAYKRRYTEGGTDSFVCVTISGDATFSGIPSGTYVDVITGDTVQCGGTLKASCSGKGNMRVYVLQTAGAPSGKIGKDGTYLK